MQPREPSGAAALALADGQGSAETMHDLFSGVQMKRFVRVLEADACNFLKEDVARVCMLQRASDTRFRQSYLVSILQNFANSSGTVVHLPVTAKTSGRPEREIATCSLSFQLRAIPGFGDLLRGAGPWECWSSSRYLI